MSASKTVELRVVNSGQYIVNGVPLLKGMRHKASPVEAAFLQAYGVCERTDDGPVTPRQTRHYGAVVQSAPTIVTRR